MTARPGPAVAAVALATAALVVSVVPASAANFSPTPPGTYQCTPAGGRIVDLTFPTGDTPIGPVFNPRGPARARVLLPSDYWTSSERYPVLYLLHGAGDNPCSWTFNTGGFRDGQPSLQAFTAQREALAQPEKVVIVMPDGGGGDYASNADKDGAGWYSDWCNPGSTGACSFGKPRWEQFHVQQLIPYIESHFRVRTDRSGRVIAGLSMGGYGAEVYAARHPELFAGAYSFSGFVDIDGAPYAQPSAFQLFQPFNNTPDSRVWGAFDTQEVRWRGHNPADLVGNLHDVDVWVRSGMGAPFGPAPDDNSPSPAEPAVGAASATFHVKLVAAGVPHVYQPYLQGQHNWYHFHEDLHLAWDSIMADFRRPPAVPAHFDYCSIEPAFGVWNWEVAVNRTVTEFLAMHDAGTDGVTLRGSGHVSVTTPPAYTPGAAYRVSRAPVASLPAPAPPFSATAFVSAAEADPCVKLPTESAGSFDAGAIVNADAQGRLAFAVDLGPSHTLQQYTPPARVAEVTNPAYWTGTRVAIAAVPGGPGGAPGTVGTPTAGVDQLPTTSAGGLQPAGEALVLAGLFLAWASRRHPGRTSSSPPRPAPTRNRVPAPAPRARPGRRGGRRASRG